VSGAVGLPVVGLQVDGPGGLHQQVLHIPPGEQHAEGHGDRTLGCLKVPRVRITKSFSLLAPKCHYPKKRVKLKYIAE